ncbi:MAG: hypothetical protein NTW13_04950 [Candidatus Omnitrophica bacterium]|nr:hypothetical protein [Candidatus Omnitrophota bacterium]
MRKKAQATLEFTVIFVIIIMLLFGLLGLWKWSADNIVRRQMWYKGSRVPAGSGSADSRVTPPPEVISNIADSEIIFLK